MAAPKSKTNNTKELSEVRVFGTTSALLSLLGEMEAALFVHELFDLSDKQNRERLLKLFVKYGNRKKLDDFMRTVEELSDTDSLLAKMRKPELEATA